MAPTRIVIGQTGDFLTVADAKDAAGQQAWQRATDVAIQFASKPGTALGAKLLALLGGRSNIGDPRQPGWLENLDAAHQIAVLQELQQLVASWHLQQGRNADGTRNPDVQGVVTMTAQGQAIISRPTTKASTAAALRLAAQDAGPARGELLVRAAVAEREAEREAADLAKAAAATRRRAPSRRRTWGDMVLAGAIRIGPTPSDAARTREKAAALDKAAAAADALPGAPAMLYKQRCGAG